MEKIKELMNTSAGNFKVETLLSALLTLVVSVIVIHFLLKFIKATLKKSKFDSVIQGFAYSGVKVFLWVIVLLILTDTLGIPSATLVASLSVVGLALSLSMQNILSNVFSGFTILMTKPFISGDYVEIAGTSGSVTTIGFFYTTLLTPDNKKINIPNASVCSSNVINFSAEHLRRIDIALTLEYGCKPERVREVLLDAAASEKLLSDSKPPVVLITEFLDSSVKYCLRAWVRPADYWDAYFALNESLLNRIENSELSFAYPHMDVNILKNDSHH
ncbi:MAG: mechanosensitive ion channel family protein [Ruminococcaceae bacterium]|nr:mechanosensitive ion channel family protein [Oscillospiraceae bacterium]